MTIPAEVVWAWVGYIFIQLIASIWWAATMQFKIGDAVDTLTEIEKDIKEATFNDSIEIVYRNRQILANEVERLERENDINNVTKNTKIAHIRAELAYLLVNKALASQKINESKSNVEVNEGQLKKYITDRVQEWEKLRLEGLKVETDREKLDLEKFINDMLTSIS